MSSVTSKPISLGILVIFGLSGLCYGESKNSKNDLPNIKLEVAKSDNSNPKLKQGVGCENLEEVEGETFEDYPMAETIPCKDKNDCKDLKPAVLHEDNFKELPTAKTDGSCEEE